MKHRTVASSLLAACLVVSGLFAYPGSGIVVDRRGQVYFADTGHGVWKIGANGQLTSQGGPRFRSAWLPRVRKVSADGRVSVVATVDRR